MARPQMRERLRSVLAHCSENHLEVVRWFVLCDGRSGVQFDAEGSPSGLDAALWRDMDVAIDTAASLRLRLLPVLFDFLLFRPRRFVNGVQLHGRRRVVADPRTRHALLDNVVRPLLRAYGKQETILGWDVINEPEWATFGYGSLNPVTSLRASVMSSWLAEVSAAVHSETNQKVTVGLASVRGLPLVSGCDLDFYQVHWYDQHELRSPLASPPMDALDRPLMLGEFPTANSRMTPAEVVTIARAAGYSGALAWSATANDPYSNLAALTATAVDGFARRA